MAAPAAAGAATVSVEPYREPPDTDPFGSCSRYMMCPANMLVVTAASGETNHLSITETILTFRESRYVVRDRSAPLVAGAGCEPIDEPQPPPPDAVVCTAATLGFQELGDGDDWISSPRGWVTGGDGDDVLTVSGGEADGGEGDDVLVVESGNADGEAGNDTVIGQAGDGGSGDDLLMVAGGRGDSGDDDLRCFPRVSGCFLDGGPGTDVLTGDSGRDRLFGRRGRDLIRSFAGRDDLDGGPGNDRLIGGAGLDLLEGAAGADTLRASEDRQAGEQPRKDRVDCGTGRRDRASVDRRDEVRRCERVSRPARARSGSRSAPG
ncbi:MAG TPA: calcium-binding protein [Thermoleophilaceae bacterium]|nr:calcium-binding protein [Thermoleophilaceae bacterium]